LGFEIKLNYIQPFMNKKKIQKKCEWGKKMCKNENCKELLHIHKNICPWCGFINDRSNLTSLEERKIVRDFFNKSEPLGTQMKKNISQIQKILGKWIYECGFFMDIESDS